MYKEFIGIIHLVVVSITYSKSMNHDDNFLAYIDRWTLHDKTIST